MAKSDLGQYGINLVSCRGSLGEEAGNASIIKWIPDSAAPPTSLEKSQIDFWHNLFAPRVSSSVLAGRKWKVLPLLEGDGGGFGQIIQILFLLSTQWPPLNRQNLILHLKTHKNNQLQSLWLCILSFWTNSKKFHWSSDSYPLHDLLWAAKSEAIFQYF